jgi:hypothetical protein
MIVCMDIDDAAWIAGYLEGEGCFFAQVSSRGYVRIGVKVNSTDGDVLQHLCSLIPQGRMRGPAPPHKNSLGTKPLWHWELHVRVAVVELINQIRPWMSVRRTAQIDALLACHTSRPALRTGRLRGPAAHGTESRWGQDCRCEECRTAHNVYQVEGRLRRKAAAANADVNDATILISLTARQNGTAYQLAEAVSLDHDVVVAGLRRMEKGGQVRRRRDNPISAWLWEVVQADG